MVGFGWAVVVVALGLGVALARRPGLVHMLASGALVGAACIALLIGGDWLGAVLAWAAWMAGWFAIGPLLPGRPGAE